MYNRLLGIAAVSGFIAVAFGAFGSHAIKPQVTVDTMALFQTANRYHFIHTIVLLLVGVLYARDESTYLKVSAYAFINGIVLFSGSLYIMALRPIVATDLSFLGPVTPLGGVFFLIGWVMLAYYGFFMAKVQRVRKKLDDYD